MKTFTLAFVLASLLSCEFVMAQAPKKPDYAAELALKLEPTRKVVYKTIGEKKLHLHLFEPGEKANKLRACFIGIHGGGWVGGEPRRFYPIARSLAEQGVLAISIEYRLVSKDSGVTVFDCVKDGRSAVRYVRSHAAELGIDPERIIVAGGSAGAHVAAGTALFDGVDDEADDLRVSPRPNGLILYYPVIDTSKAGYGNALIGSRWKELSPLHQVRPGVPPTLLFHGTGDTVTPYAGAKTFHEAMLAAGNRCDLQTNEGGVHGYLMFEKTLYDDALQRTIAFVKSFDDASRKE